MKTVKRCSVALLAAGMLGGGSGCIDIANSFLVALVLPAEYCFPVGPSTDTTWGGQAQVSIRSLVTGVDARYVDDVRATRVSDILIRVTGPYPTAADARVAGQASFRLDGGAWTALATFHPAGVAALVAALSSEVGLPAIDLIEVQASGTTAPVQQAGVGICFEVVLGADAEVQP
ncbi:MAG: hypothetical protein AB1505_04035 [Candidatus Latescibacterota bacterium]